MSHGQTRFEFKISLGGRVAVGGKDCIATTLICVLINITQSVSPTGTIYTTSPDEDEATLTNMCYWIARID